MTDTRTAPAVENHAHKKGEKYRVIKLGARLTGMVPIRGGFQGARRSLKVGEILTCRGSGMGWGSDSVPIISWEDEEVSCYAEIRPSIGGMWNSKPDPSYLELVI